MIILTCTTNLLKQMYVLYWHICQCNFVSFPSIFIFFIFFFILFYFVFTAHCTFLLPSSTSPVRLEKVKYCLENVEKKMHFFLVLFTCYYSNVNMNTKPSM